MRGHYILAAVMLVAGPASAEVLGIGREKATATIIDARGMPIGKAVIGASKKRGLIVSVEVKGLPRGEHGVHIHTIGACEGPKFLTAGAHWNPTNKLHGLSNPGGSHAGDLPNLLVGKGNRGKLKYEIADGVFDRAGGLLDDDGTSIVIHALSDDQRTDPSGNSGDRIACGVLVRK
jgi:superoxide dismutase, Cu-Zn family